jgi:hypothetical protein
MKYALINPIGRVARTSEVEFKFTPEGKEVVELTDEQAEQVESSSAPLFLIEGNLITFKAKRWAENPEAVKASLRPERDRLLDASDWTQLIDSPLDEIARDAWAVYRQDLRDLTDNVDENGEVEFPVQP